MGRCGENDGQWHSHSQFGHKGRPRFHPLRQILSHNTLQIRWVHPHLGVAKFLCASLMTEGDSLQVDDVMGDMFKNAAVTDVIGGCPKCGEWQAQISFCFLDAHP